jgi:hypothetical protein
VSVDLFGQDVHLLPLFDKQEIRLREHLFISEGVNPKSFVVRKRAAGRERPDILAKIYVT